MACTLHIARMFLCSFILLHIFRIEIAEFDQQINLKMAIRDTAVTSLDETTGTERRFVVITYNNDTCIILLTIIILYLFAVGRCCRADTSADGLP